MVDLVPVAATGSAPPVSGVEHGPADPSPTAPREVLAVVAAH